MQRKTERSFISFRCHLLLLLILFSSCFKAKCHRLPHTCTHKLTQNKVIYFSFSKHSPLFPSFRSLSHSQEFAFFVRELRLNSLPCCMCALILSFHALSFLCAFGIFVLELRDHVCLSIYECVLVYEPHLSNSNFLRPPPPRPNYR